MIMRVVIQYILGHSPHDYEEVDEDCRKEQDDGKSDRQTVPVVCQREDT